MSRGSILPSRPGLPSDFYRSFANSRRLDRRGEGWTNDDTAALAPQILFIFTFFEWLDGFRPTAPVQRFCLDVKTLNLCLPKRPRA